MRTLIVVTLLASALVGQSTLHVPAQYTTIQAGIAAAVNGDTVVVAPGTYYESLITFQGRAITVRGDQGAAQTIIDALSQGRVFNFVSGEGPSSVLEGFTITGGLPSGAGPGGRRGGGIFCDNTSPTIRDCVIVANRAAAGDPFGGDGGHGGGLACFSGAAPTIARCVIRNNSAGTGVYGVMAPPPGASGGSGGGISIENTGGPFAVPMLIDCRIEDNRTGSLVPGILAQPVFNTYAGDGGGVFVLGGQVMLVNCVIKSNATQYAYHGGSGGGVAVEGGGATLLNCTVLDNAAYGSTVSFGGRGGGLFFRLASPTVRNTIVWGNYATLGPGIFVDSASPAVTWSDIQGGFAGAGNISTDPMVDGTGHLIQGSPCIDAGDPSTTGLPATDIDGDPRVQLMAVDMGADEWPTAQAGITLAITPVATGNVIFSVSGGVPGAPLWNWFTMDPLNTTSPYGGWLGGLHIPFGDFVAQYQVSLAGNTPFGGSFDPAGCPWTFTLPASIASLLSGTTWHGISASTDATGAIVLSLPLLGFTFP